MGKEPDLWNQCFSYLCGFLLATGLKAVMHVVPVSPPPLRSGIVQNSQHRGETCFHGCSAHRNLLEWSLTMLPSSYNLISVAQIQGDLERDCLDQVAFRSCSPPEASHLKGAKENSTYCGLTLGYARQKQSWEVLCLTPDITQDGFPGLKALWLKQLWENRPRYCLGIPS